MDQGMGDLIFSPAESEAAIRRVIEAPPLSASIVLPVEPGHVMSREKYQQLLEQQKQK